MNPDRERTKALIAGNDPDQEPLTLERPDQQDDGRWRGPRGTSIDCWIRELERIIGLLEEREQGRYKTDLATAWRMDCLNDMLACLRYNERAI
jgi:hypothetical protein